MTRYVLLVLAVLSATLAAQTTPSVEADKAYRFEFTHDGLNVTGYPIVVDGATAMTAPLSALVNGTVTVSLVGLPAGSHTIQAIASGPGGDTAGPVLTFTSKTAPPPAPNTIRCTTFEGVVDTDGVVVLRCR